MDRKVNDMKVNDNIKLVNQFILTILTYPTAESDMSRTCNNADLY